MHMRPGGADGPLQVGGQLAGALFSFHSVGSEDSMQAISQSLCQCLYPPFPAILPALCFTDSN